MQNRSLWHFNTVCRTMGRSLARARLFKSASVGVVVLQPDQENVKSNQKAPEIDRVFQRLKSAAERPVLTRPSGYVPDSSRRLGNHAEWSSDNGQVQLDGSADEIAAVLHHHLGKKLKFLSYAAQDTDTGTLESGAGTPPVLPRAMEVEQCFEQPLLCRLFRQVKLQPLSALTVQMESEFSSAQKQLIVEASAAGKAQKQNAATFRDVSEETIQTVAVSGAEVLAYAALAARTAAKRVRPASKQVNLGPRKVIRCGWNGESPGPLELLAKQQRARAIFDSLIP
eukprot:jgi/Ulvmu1/10997/UM007_0177.1